MHAQRTIGGMRYDAIVLDLGNTLLPFGEREDRAFYGALQRALTDALGPMPDFAERGRRAKSKLHFERRRTTMREVTVAELLECFLDGAPPPGLADSVERAVSRVFLDTCRFPEGTRERLERLARRQPVALLSNFFLTGPIEELLRREDLTRYFAHIEVSATSGYMKPHGTPFARVREALGLNGGRALMVGDDFWCDVVGGHRAGFETALTHEHRQEEPFDAEAPDVKPGRILKSLDELTQ
jgi:FMN phosphatase YigB (HAD superfamily)